jgi:hypothetical protein
MHVSIFSFGLFDSILSNASFWNLIALPESIAGIGLIFSNIGYQYFVMTVFY